MQNSNNKLLSMMFCRKFMMTRRNGTIHTTRMARVVKLIYDDGSYLLKNVSELAILYRKICMRSMDREEEISYWHRTRK